MPISTGSSPKSLLSGGAARFAPRKSSTATPLHSATQDSLEDSGIAKKRKAAFSRKKAAFAEQSGYDKKGPAK